MSSIVDQVRDVQDQLRNQAERLGDLNLKSNNFIEMNQKLALQIVDLKNKLAKKKHMIEQQNKDKMLIHQKLIKAQREKQLLQIQNHRKQQQKQKQIQKQGSQMNTISRPITNHIQTLTLGEELNMGQKVATQQKNQQDTTNQTKQQQSLQDTKNTEKYQQPTQPQPQNHGEQYTETDRGEYQPPMLFQENQQNSEEKQQKSDDQDSAQDQDQEILNKLRATVKDEEDEDDEDQS